MLKSLSTLYPGGRVVEILELFYCCLFFALIEVYGNTYSTRYKYYLNSKYPYILTLEEIFLGGFCYYTPIIIINMMYVLIFEV